MKKLFPNEQFRIYKHDNQQELEIKDTCWFCSKLSLRKCVGCAQRTKGKSVANGIWFKPHCSDA